MTKKGEKKYPKPVDHDAELDKISDDVYCVHGSFKMPIPGMKVSNSMTVVRRDGNLTVVNAIRVKPEMEAEIKKLGAIKHIVRLSSNHGAADPYWIDTNPDAKYWDVPGAAESTEKVTKVPATPNILEDEGELPGVPGSKVLVIKNLRMPDVIAWIPDGNGMLLTVDFIQDGRPGAPHTSFVAKTLVGMIGVNCCGTPPPFQKFCGAGDLAENVPRVLALEWDTLVPAHGRVIKGNGKEVLKEGWKSQKEGKFWKCPKIE